MKLRLSPAGRELDFTQVHYNQCPSAFIRGSIFLLQPIDRDWTTHPTGEGNHRSISMSFPVFCGWPSFLFGQVEATCGHKKGRRSTHSGGQAEQLQHICDLTRRPYEADNCCSPLHENANFRAVFGCFDLWGTAAFNQAESFLKKFSVGRCSEFWASHATFGKSVSRRVAEPQSF